MLSMFKIRTVLLNGFTFNKHKTRAFHMSPASLWLKVGDTHSITKAFSKEDVKAFSEVSEDRNPLHLDEEFAKTSQFGQCVVHGALTNGLVSATLGEICGIGSIFADEYIKYTAPLYINEKVTSKVTVSKRSKRRLEIAFECFCPDSDKVIAKGEVKCLLGDRPYPYMQERYKYKEILESKK